MATDRISQPAGRPLAWVIGATSGIGAAIVPVLRAAGWGVVASGRSGPELQVSGDGLWRASVDVRSDASIDDTWRRIGRECGRVTAVIVSVRDQPRSDWSGPTDAWARATDVKLLGFARVGRRVMDELAAAGGSLIAIAGSAASTASADHPLGFINAGLRHLTRSMALRWGPAGGRVIGISPGPTRTPALAATMPDRRPGDPPLPLAAGSFRGRLVEPEEIAQLVLFCLSAAAAPLNGSTLLADDGSSGGAVS